MEEEGQHIIKLNIGNLAAFGLEPPDEIVQDMIRNLPNAAGYTDSKGLFAPRKAVVHYTPAKACQGRDDRRRLPRQRRVRADHDEHERAAQRRRRGADSGARLPALDGVGRAFRRHAGALPLRRGGRLAARPRRHGREDHAADAGDRRHQPEQPDRRALSDRGARADRRARAPARPDRLRRRDLRQDALRRPQHTSIASLADDVLFLTFNGLSKNYRSCGYRAGWMVVSGEKRHARDYIEGLGMLASMRLCSNTPGQLAIQTALGGYQSIDDLVAPGGRLARQRDLAHSAADRDPRRDVRQAEGRALHVPASSTRSSIRSPTTSSSPTSCWPSRRC